MAGKRKTKVKESAKLAKPPPEMARDPIIYWTTLLVLAIANLLAAVVLMPFLLLSPGLHFYLTLAIMAVFFGYVFSMLVSRIEKAAVHHHLLAVLFIPVLALIIILLISNSASRIALLLNLEYQANPLLISAFYIMFFLLPHFLHLAATKLQGR